MVRDRNHPPAHSQPRRPMLKQRCQAIYLSIYGNP
jgi:hypothetical protein